MAKASLISLFAFGALATAQGDRNGNRGDKDGRGGRGGFRPSCTVVIAPYLMTVPVLATRTLTRTNTIPIQAVATDLIYENRTATYAGYDGTTVFPGWTSPYVITNTQLRTYSTISLSEEIYYTTRPRHTTTTVTTTFTIPTTVTVTETTTSTPLPQTIIQGTELPITRTPRPRTRTSTITYTTDYISLSTFEIVQDQSTVETGLTTIIPPGCTGSRPFS